MNNNHVKFDASLDVKVEVTDEVTQSSQNEDTDVNEWYDLSHGGVSPKIKIETCNTAALNDNEQVKALDLNCEKVEEGSLVDDLKDEYGQSAVGVREIETDETHIFIASDVIHAEDELTKVEDGEGSVSALLADDDSENLIPADTLHCGKLRSILLVGFYFNFIFAVAVECYRILDLSAINVKTWIFIHFKDFYRMTHINRKCELFFLTPCLCTRG